MSLSDLKKWNWGTRLAYARNLILLCLIYNFGGRKYLFGADGGMHQYLRRSVKPGGRLSFSLKLVAVIASGTIMEGTGPQTKSGMGPLRPSRNFPQQKSEVGGVGPILVTDHPHFRILKTIATLS